MKTTFKHSPFVHALGIVGPILFAWPIDELLSTPLVRGGELARVTLVSICAAFCVGTLLLYLTSGINRYETADDGLRIHRLLRTDVYPWSEVRRIDLNNLFNYIVMRGEGRVIAYTSTDLFPDLIELVRAIHDRSGCVLSPLLAEMLAAAPTSDAA